MDEKSFYKSLLARSRGVPDARMDRIENEVSAGWPDVLLRAPPGIHVWLELKIAKGPRARIVVRPEQINWIENHTRMGGRALVLAQNEQAPGEFWVVKPEILRECATQGCLGQPCYHLSSFAPLIRTWRGGNDDLQSKDPTLARVRSRLAFTPKRCIVSRAAMSRLREHGI